jgi:hypothetical protein
VKRNEGFPVSNLEIKCAHKIKIEGFEAIMTSLCGEDEEGQNKAIEDR